MITDFDRSEGSPRHVPGDSDTKKPEAPRHIQITEQVESRTPSINLSGLKLPALLFNSDLEIVWQNAGAIEKIWQRKAAANNGNPSLNILDLIFDLSFKRQVANFSQCLEFFLGQIRSILSADEVRNLVSGMPVERIDVLLPLLEKMYDWDAQSELFGGYLKVKMRSGRQTAFNVVALNCGEGRLLIFDPYPEDASNDHRTAEKSVTNRFEQIQRQPKPVMTPTFLLAAEVSRAAILRTELLPDDHWRLINSICRACLGRIEQFGGIFGQHVGHGFFAYFLPGQNTEVDGMKVIECALDLKAEAVALGRKLKISKDWPHDIDLNIGIHFEKAYVGTLPLSSGDMLTSFGEGLRVASTISHCVEDGQIWATKPVIGRIPANKQNALRFGLLRTNQQQHKRFMRNAFIPIGSAFNLPPDGESYQDALGFLPITQIFDYSGADG